MAFGIAIFWKLIALLAAKIRQCPARNPAAFICVILIQSWAPIHWCCAFFPICILPHPSGMYVDDHYYDSSGQWCPCLWEPWFSVDACFTWSCFSWGPVLDDSDLDDESRREKMWRLALAWLWGRSHHTKEQQYNVLKSDRGSHSRLSVCCLVSQFADDYAKLCGLLCCMLTAVILWIFSRSSKSPARYLHYIMYHIISPCPDRIPLPIWWWVHGPENSGLALFLLVHWYPLVS